MESSPTNGAPPPRPPPGNRDGPLSWEEARSILRASLEKYLDDDPPSVTHDKNDHGDTVYSSASASASLFSKWIRLDLDLYLGALALSVTLLMVASFALSPPTSSALHALAEKRIYRGEVAGGFLLTVGALSGVWVVRRRRFLCWNDSNTARRREVRKFLRATAAASSSSSSPEPTDAAVPPSSNGNNTTTTSTNNNNNTLLREEISNLTAQTGVYPVYRRKQAPPGQQQSSSYVWSRIPSLLLVKGDWIALQIGDVGPAACMLKRYGAAPLFIQVGERLTVEHFASTAEQLTATLPRGRKTLSVGSNGSEGGGLVDDHFLTMCNNMNIFTIVESPIDDFLRRKTVLGKPSQVSRQVQAVREVLFVLSFLFLVVTAAIALGRLVGTGNSSDIALVVQMPLLASLGVLPVVAPAFLFFLEVCGTSRILTTVHEYSVTGSAAATPTSSYSAKIPSDAAEKAAAAAAAVPNKSRLLLRYILATSLTRLSLWSLYESLCRFLQRICALSSSSSTVNQSSINTRDDKVRSRSKLVRVPPASLNLLEKVGVATAFTLVDDELACEPQSIPQQLLIPSGKGLKLLDLCPAYESDSDDDGETDSSGSATGRRPRGRSFDDSDSDQSDDGRQNSGGPLRRKVLLKRMRRYKSVLQHKSVRSEESEGTQEEIRFDVQFEEPNWWQYLPSLKCIGLACLLHEEQKKTEVKEDEVSKSAADNDDASEDAKRVGARSALVKLVCHERRSRQLRSLAECIGFSTQENAFGKRGDLTPFTERLRLHILSNHLYRNRLALDTHERSSEQSRWWGLIRADSTSIILEDSRTKAFQLLTIGDPAIVTKLCNEAWQGEISTILPLAAIDRQTIIETTNNWKLADLDVAAFSYTPVPHTLETQLSTESGSHLYLLDHAADPHSSILKDKNVSPEWSFVKNQVFLGVLGSLVVPRLLLKRMIDVLADAGVRFVYFSPRNMRRQKELAIQLGLDVSWNCAISLRPLESGEEDPHRMVSNYADWDVNAKLPHGVEDVRKHLEEVDNVPLLVSLFTDVTKVTTKEMIEIFQKYNDTVITVGISHLTRNYCLFSSADIAVGIDILDTDSAAFDGKQRSNILPAELEFVNAISAHACAFRFRGASSISHIPSIIQKGRESLEATIAAAVFLITGCLSFSLYILFTVCSPQTSIPFVPTLGCVIYLQFFLPTLGLSMAMSGGDKDTMKRVPEKNDKSLTFGRKEKSMFYKMVVVKALLPALLPQILHLIVFGELILHFEPELVDEKCQGARNWVNIVRCEGLRNFSGPAKTSAGSLVFGQFALCIFVSSAGFVNRFLPLFEGKPWISNFCWLICSLFVIGFLALYVGLTTEEGTASALPWYYYVIAVLTPFLCLAAVEGCKRPEIKQEKRAEKLRRLQFETRLGAWSPR